jgi:DNA-binding transcriptional ArsR family regulator
MAIRFELRDDNVRAMRFATSPLVEAVVGLNALLFPRQRALQHPWIRSMRDLTAALRREIRAFGFALDHAIPDCILPDPGRATEVPWDDALGAIAELPGDVAALEIARPAFAYALGMPEGVSALTQPSVQAHLRERAERHGPGAVALAALTARDPEAVRDRFVAMLQAFWDEAFADVWSALGPELARVARRDARIAARSGVYAVLGGGFAGTVVDRRAGWFERESPHDHTVRPTRSNPVVLTPSVLVWPYLRVACDAPWPLTVIYPPADVRAAADTPPPPDELSAALDALADPVRLRILRSIAERPRTTQELAQLRSLAPGAVSRHLGILARAGLALRERDGYYVLYRAAPERLAEISEALGSYADAGRSTERSARPASGSS